MSKDFDVDNTKEKVYIQHPKFGCVARLCKVSGDFMILPCVNLFEAKYDILRGISFERFKYECFKRYGVEIEDSMKPEVFK